MDFDLDNCARSEADAHLRWLQALRADYDAAAAQSCISAYAAMCGEVDAAVSQACAHVFRGRQPLNDDCTTDEECAPARGQRARCQYTIEEDFTHMVFRTWAQCVPDDHANDNFVSAEPGQACTAACTWWRGEEHCSGLLAEQGLTPACKEADGRTCTDARCEPLPTKGERCVGGRCDNRSAFCNAAGVCAPYQAADALCSQNNECDEGLYCDATNSTCAKLRGLGEHCDDAAQCASGVCSGTCMPLRPSLCQGGLPAPR